ncbi:universal stress protein [Hymenobacter sp. BRD128]|uniref:universal stress protein n=1 Tax=Hymenobacter sp. BRD128 TaxID=2675878 RepID=UPI00156625E7|nr:universal stress protein [Hymenobacter sp. BRD128]QKG55258.1 universal stress protein [Hymenobacter sp. BRD128]
MKTDFIVFTDGTPANEFMLAYAAVLAAPLGATLHLVHVLAQPLVALEFGPPLLDTDYVPAVRAGLLEAAARLPVPATVELLEDDNWYSALDQLLAAYQPALLLAGLSATDGPLDEWLSNRALPLAHRTGYPLLLVPEFLAAMYLRPPRRLVLAVEDRPFTLTPEGRALAPLLARLSCAVVPVTVLPPTGPTRAAPACGPRSAAG